MKKIYLLLAAFAVTFGAVAQDDFAVNLLSHSPGDTDDSDPLLFQFEVENVGTSSMAAGDTLWLGLSFDGAPLQLSLTGGFSGFILEDGLAPGETFTVPDVNIDWLDQTEAVTVEVCAVVYGNGNASFDVAAETAIEAIQNDDNTANNTACISAELPVVDDSGIEDLSLVLSNVYVAAGNLILVNDGVNAENQANLNIVNMAGQIVQTENFVITEGTTTIELGTLPAGIYIVAIEVEGAVITEKIVIQ